MTEPKKRTPARKTAEAAQGAPKAAPTRKAAGDPAARPKAGSAKNARKKAGADDARIGGPRVIADLMPRIGDAAFRRFGFVQSSIVTRWPEIAGARIAAVSTPESIRFPAGKKAQGTLSLSVMSGHAPIIQHVLPEIIDRVNRFFGYPAVARVTIHQGMAPAARPAGERPRRPAPAQPVPQDLALPQDLGESLRDIGDPELRAVLEAMAQGLANAPALRKIS